MQPTEFRTRQQTAAELRIDTRTLDRWRRRGYGPPSAKIGKHRMYRRADIEAWLNAQFTQPAATDRTSEKALGDASQQINDAW